MTPSLNPISAVALSPILSAFRGGDFECLIHVPNPQPGQLRQVMDAYRGVVNRHTDTPKILDVERGVVNFLGFGEPEKRGHFESWLLFEYGWEAFPRPLRAHVAFRNPTNSNFAEDTAKVFLALQSMGWTYRRDDHRIGSGFQKPGTPATDFNADIEGERVKAKVFWQAYWEGGRVIPNWVCVGGTPTNPKSVQSRFSSLIFSAELISKEDRYLMAGHGTLRQGLSILLAPLIGGEGPLSLIVPQESAAESDWPHCRLEFQLR